MDLSAWIWLHRLELPPMKARRLLEAFGCPETIRDAEPRDLRNAGADLHADTLARLLAAQAQTDVSKEIDTLDHLGALAIPFASPAYPAPLKTIPDPRGSVLNTGVWSCLERAGCPVRRCYALSCLVVRSLNAGCGDIVHAV